MMLPPQHRPQQPNMGDVDQATLAINKDPTKWTPCVALSVAAK